MKSLKKCQGRALLPALIALAVVACGCSRAAGPYRIGVILKASGGTSDEYHALNEVVEGINSNGGIKGNPIEIVLAETTGDEETNVLEAKRLIESEKVLMVLMAETGGISNAVAVVFSQSRTPMMYYGMDEPSPGDLTDWNIIKPRFEVQSLTPLTPEQRRREAVTNMSEAFEIIKEALLKGGRDKGRIRQQMEAGAGAIRRDEEM